MSNVAGKAYGMNVITPSNPKLTWINRILFMLTRSIPATLKGLLGLSIIHFARWVIIKKNEWPDLGQGQNKIDNDYVLFMSNFNGTWDQYIDAFSDGIPSGLDLLWYSATKYPGSIPITSFKRYITYNQVYTDYYYNATPGSAQRDIKSAMSVYNAIKKLEKAHASQTAEDFQKTYHEVLSSIQGCFGEPGYGPIASLDTENADRNREPFVKRADKAVFERAKQEKIAENYRAKRKVGS